MNQRYGATFMRRTSILGLVTVSAILFAPMVSASDVSTNYDASFESFLPLLLALVVAYFVRRWFIPQQLKNLQVAFEIEDDLYEVHRITRTLRDSRRLLKAGRVGYGVLLYIMGMTGVLNLIAELLFDAEVFSQLNLYIIATLILIPVIVSKIRVGQANFFEMVMTLHVESKAKGKHVLTLACIAMKNIQIHSNQGTNAMHGCYNLHV